MARPPRQELAGGIHHVWARRVDKQSMFVDDLDRRRYLGGLGVAATEWEWWVLAYCLMGNHVHLVIETRQTNLGDGMRVLHGSYAQDFNERHGRTGHLFQGRYGSKLIQKEAHLWVVSAYIALNPVDAGLVADPADYPWSSHGAVASRTAPPWLASGRLLEHFGSLGGEASQRYAQFVSGRAAGR